MIDLRGAACETIPLAPRTARAIDLAIGEHADGPDAVWGYMRRQPVRAGWAGRRVFSSSLGGVTADAANFRLILG